jgi:hypothetical protein
MYLSVLLAGFGGGAVRGLVGFVKHQFSYKNVGFKVPYFLGMTFLSGIIGLSVAFSMQNIGFTLNEVFSPALSFIVGYAGGDFVENIYKIIIKKSSLYPKE